MNKITSKKIASNSFLLTKSGGTVAIIQAILDDVKLRYKHTFTTDQVLVWANEEQRELFEILELDTVPFSLFEGDKIEKVVIK